MVKAPAESKSKKAGLFLGVSRVDRCLRKARISKNVGGTASVVATAMIEEVIEDIVQRAGEHAKQKKSKRVAVVHLISAVRSDPDTAMLLFNFAFGSANQVPKAIDLILDSESKKARYANMKNPPKKKASGTKPSDSTTSDVVDN
jgi:histone H3/H4